MVPAATAGTYTWSSLTLSKGINLVGAGMGVTNVTIADALGWTISKAAARFMLIKGFSFYGLGNNGYPRPITIYGSWLSAEPVIFYQCDFYYGTASGLSGPILESRVCGGVIISDCTWHPYGQPNDFGFVVTVQDSEESWLAADSLGTNDSTGKKNFYFEHNEVLRDSTAPGLLATPQYTTGGTRGCFDMSDNARMVCRHNNFYNSGAVQSHGRDSGIYGTRHFEIYSNYFHYTTAGYNYPTLNNYEVLSSNCSQGMIWIRAGTGVIFDNDFDIMDSAGCWNPGGYHLGQIYFSVRAAEDDRIQGNLSCAAVSYPIPAQCGQNWNGSAWFTDPTYIWGNRGIDWTASVGLGVSYRRFTDPYSCAGTYTMPDYVWQSGRDYILGGGDGNGGSAKPGYTAYTYPHPLIATALASIGGAPLNGRSTPQLFL